MDRSNLAFLAKLDEQAERCVQPTRARMYALFCCSL